MLLIFLTIYGIMLCNGFIILARNFCAVDTCAETFPCSGACE